MSDLVIVSNRGPFSFSEASLSSARDRLDRGMAPDDPKFGEGGLVRAMAGLLKKVGPWKPSWIGASMGDRDIDVARGHYSGLFRRMVEEGHAPDRFPLIEIDPDNRMRFRYRAYDFYLRFVFFDTRHMHSYYSKFANGFLWPLMHLTREPLFYKKTRIFPKPRFEKNDFVQYTSSGVTFANTILDEIQRGGEIRGDNRDVVVWLQDYHLLQVSEVLKSLLVEEGLTSSDRKRIHVGQFIHTPLFNIHEIQGLIREDKRARVKTRFDEPFGENIEDVLQRLVWGMLSNDFVGFQTKEYCDHFLETLQEWFPVDIRVSGGFYVVSRRNRKTAVGALPIGLDVESILSEVTHEKRLECELEGRPLIENIEADREKGLLIFGGLERCDYTKGLIQRIGVFKHSWAGLRQEGKQARFYQVTAPSRSDIPEYRQLNAIVDEEVEALNRHMEDHVVIRIDEGIPAPQNYRFMKEMDVMLVTPLEDGMNLVAFEYILSQKYKSPEKRGLLVLSMCGASRVLKESGFDEEDGVVYINVMNVEDAGEKIVGALGAGHRISERLLNYVERDRRVDNWAQENIDAILNAGKD